MEYELYHHGILGMKWGIRRYQNKDGTLTSDGRKRYREIKKEQRSNTLPYAGPFVGERNRQSAAQFAKEHKQMYEDIRQSSNNLEKFYEDFSNNEKLVSDHLYYSTVYDGVPNPFEDLPDYSFEKYLPAMLKDAESIDLAFENYVSGRVPTSKDSEIEKARAKYETLLDDYQEKNKRLKDAEIQFCKDLLGKYYGKPVREYKQILTADVYRPGLLGRGKKVAVRYADKKYTTAGNLMERELILQRGKN